MVDGEAKRSSDVVLITSDRLGTGDRKLGKVLMKAFLNTLCDVEPNRLNSYSQMMG